mmetsp:Transcript_3755/g.4875  ORF Transcript_3755/g.4875 Transcript_3755/m.4875 type:complete len:219 (+) Transcript_3755:54-710(+)
MFSMSFCIVAVSTAFFSFISSSCLIIEAFTFPPAHEQHSHISLTRESFLQKTVATSILSLVGVSTIKSSKATAVVNDGKLRNLSDEELKKIITADVLERSFLATADFTREIYDESSIFTDEIDSYPMDKFIKGTKALFVAEGSSIRLVGDVMVTSDKAEFRFDEDLMFRIPFRPVVSLSGRVVLKRDVDSGLITSYREYWDQDIPSVLKTAKFTGGLF